MLQEDIIQGGKEAKVERITINSSKMNAVPKATTTELTYAGMGRTRGLVMPETLAPSYIESITQLAFLAAP